MIVNGTIRTIPLIGPYDPDDVLAWTQEGPRTARQFLADVSSLAEALPNHPTVLNLSQCRYRFVVGLAAAMVRHQVTLLPPSRTPNTIQRLIGEYPDSYALLDQDDTIKGIESLLIQLVNDRAGEAIAVPDIPVDQVVAVAFTSGSTGQPRPHIKTWGALTTVAQGTGLSLGISNRMPITVVATVPHQHMFGLEASVMLPILHGLPIYAGRPLFPADVAAALSEVRGRWLLVTTPLHLRACVAERVAVSPGGLILSATAPLARTLAEDAEQLFQAEVHEIFGFTEAGSVAERRTVEGDGWRPLQGIRVMQNDASCLVEAWYLPALVPVPDRVTVNRNGTFTVHGREEDQVDVAGHRVSLGELNHKLLEVDGVQDGVFFMPDDGVGSVTRLMAFVVAPGKASEDIQRSLRASINPIFLPRPLFCVPSLPRNGTGKLPREVLRELARQLGDKDAHHGA